MTPSQPKLTTQHVFAAYIKKNVMKEWLKENFGANFKATIQNGHYQIQAPREITKEEIAYLTSKHHYISNFEEQPSLANDNPSSEESAPTTANNSPTSEGGFPNTK
ncbi:hypothetical protein GGTG_05855 [Gaeumannomyces tritici R3-111a-1]|uniref:Uncharacterized protein n=1 Tax=Gaeumannomyces tritici (strain R3-111a-1) TaxID=644352 RepID=J3NX48_GAET3|nr:hypothetical protein GGTG_05855 [Gaeumannomyces tritici R3-111a-1]EJT75930.1 hypothetical protein GGTG_05855 [Gaeumannomyces tritici R3-111a-1]